ncbi:RNA-binding protein squid-like [Leptinotarsa decemlineata]|uniref:RNA-binding protein squid-like n=1 Tax=Leptinotarsa decemlineata TaxID=7539 RepID=UPI003D3087B3
MVFQQNLLKYDINGYMRTKQNNGRFDDIKRRPKYSRTRKICVSGFNNEIDRQKLQSYFEQFGEVKHLTLLTSEECSGASKKHAVIVFVDSSSVDKLTSMTPVFAGDTLTVKRILPRILVELTTKINHCDIIHYLAGFGKISDITSPLDENNIQKKGYWFVTYESEIAVENILNKEKHFIKNIALNIEEAIFE